MRARVREARHLSPDAQAVVREQAVAAVTPPGRSTVEGCRLLGLRRPALSPWLTRQARGGRHPVQACLRGRPHGGRLTGGPAAQLVRTWPPCGPAPRPLPGSLGTRKAVGERIARREGRRVSGWTIGRARQAWGFTPQKLRRRAAERDPKAVQRWLAVESPRIRAAATRAGAQIAWGDEMGLRAAQQAGPRWGKRGQPPGLRGPGRCGRCHRISAIPHRGRLYFMVFRHRVTARGVLPCCRRWLQPVRQPVLLLVDGHPVQTAAVTPRWRRHHRERLRLGFLPPDSPELNPDEYLNQAVKTNALGRRPPRTRMSWRPTSVVLFAALSACRPWGHRASTTLRSARRLSERCHVFCAPGNIC
jgi:transposase-like protein